jgi:hypothetical protein
VKVGIDVFNLFNRKGSDIHFHPVEPRSVRLTLGASF